MQKFYLIILLSLVVAPAAFAEKKCSNSLEKSYRVLESNWWSEVREYQHRIRPSMFLKHNPPVVVNLKTGKVTRDKATLVIVAESEPLSQGIYVTAPQGYQWKFALRDVNRQEWHYQLQPVEVRKFDYKEGELIKMSEVDPAALKNNRPQKPPVADSRFFGGDKPIHDSEIYEAYGLQLIKGTTLMILDGKSAQGRTPAVLRRAHLLKNSLDQILMIYREGDVNVIGFGRYARYDHESYEARQLADGERPTSTAFKQSILSDAIPFFENIGVHSGEIKNHRQGVGSFYPITLRGYQSILFAMVPSHAQHGPSIETILKNFADPQYEAFRK